MVEESPDILKQIVDAINSIREYLHRQALSDPNRSFGEMELLPAPIPEVPPKAFKHFPPEEEIVVVSPGRRSEDQGYMLHECDAAVPGQAETRAFSYKAHCGAGFCTNDNNTIIWTIPDCLNADLVIFPEGRACQTDYQTDEHPMKKGLYSYAASGYGMQNWKVELEGSDDWTDIVVPVVLVNGAIVQLYGPSGFSETCKLQVRVNTSGELQFRFLSTAQPETLDPAPFMFYLGVMVIRRIDSMDVPEIGTSDTGLDIYETRFCDHEVRLEEWDPETDPTPYEWGDGLWRQ